MKDRIFNTVDSHAPLVIRVMLGLVIFPYGAQKLLGWFGGYGFSGTMGFFTETMGIPWLVGFLVILLGSVGALALMVGVATRILAACYVVLGIAIVVTSHVQHVFFMNWFGNQQGEGYEYFLFWIGMALSLVISEAGSFSIDRKIASSKAGQK